LALLNFHGIKVRFQIRSDVRWHDGVPLTVEDIKFAMAYIKNFPKYEPVCKYLVWSQIVDRCTVDIFVNTTSQWILYDLATLATMFPKHIYDRPDSVNAPLWTISYQDWTGTPPPAEYPFMKALIGCGPYVFDYWDPANNIARIQKFLDYWVDGPLKQNFIVPQRVDPDTPFEYSVEVVNTGSKDIWTDELVPATIDYIEITLDGNVIDVIDGPIVIAPFDYVVLGPYVMPGIPLGYHYLDCHTYEEGYEIDTYICPVYVTIREDLNLDFSVDFLDLLIFEAAFDSQPGPPLPPPHGIWDERADIDGNYYVNFLDQIALAAMYGWPGGEGPTPDVAVINVTTSKTGCLPMETVGEGYKTKINVTVENQCRFVETFDVTVYANTTMIYSVTDITLTQGSSQMFSFTWDTTGLAKGNYTISANATIVWGETQTGDNILVYGIIEVVIPGDISGDRIINFLDAILLGTAFSSQPNDPNWNPNSDINGDEVVNFLDGIILGMHFGQTNL
jgi:hypothetical protein